MTTREPILTRFSASSTADDVVKGVDLTGVRAIVTGASSGIGVETARALTAAGADVTLAVRNTTAGDAVAQMIEESTGANRPRVLRLDLANRASVARFVEAWGDPLHLLVNNAGLVTGGLERTRDGWELQFATNHLGHFALAVGLHDALAAGSSGRDGARIVGRRRGRRHLYLQDPQGTLRLRYAEGRCSTWLRAMCRWSLLWIYSTRASTSPTLTRS